MTADDLRDKAVVIIEREVSLLHERPLKREQFIEALRFAATVGQIAIDNEVLRARKGKDVSPINAGIENAAAEYVTWLAIVLAGLDGTGAFSPPKQFGDGDRG